MTAWANRVHIIIVRKAACGHGKAHQTKDLFRADILSVQLREI
jgi:hypothetical protein